jgi:MATE family multidrug resistance protein
MTAETSQNLEPSQRPLVELISLAAPTVAQSVSYTVMMFIDTWMLSRLGADEFTAAGNAGMFGFSIICFGFGVLLVVNTLVSQSFGRGEFSACGRYLWQGIWVAIAYWILVLALFPVAGRVFPLLGHPPRLAELEGTYLRIVLGATVFKMIGTALGQFLLATNRPNSVMASAAIGVSVNALIAYAIVLGRWGAPQLGVVGAAWAQNVGTFVEMAVLVVFAFSHQRTRFNVTDWKFCAREAWTLVKIGAGSGLQIVADVLAWTMFLNGVMGTLGEAAMAANQIMFRYMVVSFMPAVGISQAVTALVGRYIGMQRVDVAMQRANLGFKVAAVWMLCCGLMMVTFRHSLIGVFTNDPQLLRLGATLLIFAGLYQLFDAMYVVYNGALRGAGDTFIPAVATAGLCWTITVGGGYFIARYFPQFGVAGPWIACTSYGIILGIFILTRFRRGGWQAIHLEESAASNVPAESDRLSPVIEPS